MEPEPSAHILECEQSKCETSETLSEPQDKKLSVASKNLPAGDDDTTRRSLCIDSWRGLLGVQDRTP